MLSTPLANARPLELLRKPGHLASLNKVVRL